MSQYLESAEELTVSMAERSHTDALLWFTAWLARRDQISDQLTNEDLAAALETLAAELRHEATSIPGGRTAGLDIAASHLSDSAQATRAGDQHLSDSGGAARSVRRASD